VAIDVQVPVILPIAADDYITTYGTATLYLEYGTATTPADGTATTPLVSGTEQYDVWVTGADLDWYYRWRVGDSDESTFTTYSPTYQLPLAYATLQEVTRGLDLPDSSRDDELEASLVEVTDFITNKVCGGRSFFRDPVGTGTKTLTLDVNFPNQRKLSLARGRRLDIISLSSVSVALQTGDGYDTVASGATGFYLIPDYPALNHPYEDVALSDLGSTYTTFPTGYRTVQLVGAFGWSTVPYLVRRATVEMVRWLWNNRGQEGQPVGLSQFGAPVFAGLPKTVRELYMSQYAWKDYIG
jgi:hypothetical protein